MSTTTMLEVRDFKRKMVDLTDRGVLTPYDEEKLRIIRRFLDVIEDCREYTKRGAPRDWILYKTIDEKMKEDGHHYKKRMILEVISTMFPEVANKDDNKRRLSRHIIQRMYVPNVGFVYTYANFILRRGVGHVYIFARPLWTTIWKNIYFPSPNV